MVPDGLGLAVEVAEVEAAFEAVGVEPALEAAEVETAFEYGSMAGAIWKPSLFSQQVVFVLPQHHDPSGQDVKGASRVGFPPYYVYLS